MLVRELIGGDVLSCSVETEVSEAARMMLDNDAGSLAVITDGDLVGIVTERDLIKYVAEGKASEARVGTMMTPSPDSLEPDVDASYAADWMLAAGYRHLPVVEGEDLIGIVSIKDVLWGLTQGRENRG